MRILANENFPLAAVNALRQDGHDVLWVRTESPGISDRDVLSRAQLDARVVVTFDKDVGELAWYDLLRWLKDCDRIVTGVLRNRSKWMHLSSLADHSPVAAARSK